MTPRKVLNELKWREDMDIDEAEVWVSDRARKEGYRVLLGKDIKELNRRYFRTETSTIPYYKIFKIAYKGKVLLERSKP